MTEETARTVGVDLAAQPAGTAIAAIEWSGPAARLVDLQLGVEDARIVELCAGATTVGIDCPFGWPMEFVEFVSAHGRGEVAPREFSGKEWRQRIRYRDTDRYVHDRIGKWPLSVATDLLGLAAMHGAELLEAFEASGVEVDRAGGGMLVEVYPAASLRIWGIDVAGYTRDATSLERAAGRVLDAAPWLTVSDAQLALMSRSNDALDAVVACFTARAHSLGQTEPVPEAIQSAAQIEGWIALPNAAIADLVAAAIASRTARKARVDSRR